MAILLDEYKLLERTTIYATDISYPALETARLGIYSLETMKQGSANYMEYRGISSLSDYYHVNYGAAKISSRIKRKITFSRHSLVDDKSFGEMQLIICRNVLIYFNEKLKNEVLELFLESLEFGGYLCLGDKESLMFSSVENHFSVIDDKAKIYKKIRI
jgi:chemotaxis protein methyltransferase CheR